MFHNYLVTALRNFGQHKLYSFINIAGLTVGLTCAIFIILFVRDQLSYDRWIPGTENLYRVGHSTHVPGQPLMWTSKIPFPVTQAMLEQIPEVRARTRLIRSQVTVSVENRQFPEIVNSVDPNFFQVIHLPLIAGDPTSVFAHPDSVVLSEARARKYFGHGSALGKTITISANYCDSQGKCQSQQHALVVSGILHDLPHNTQMAADLVMPNTSQADPTDWNTKTNWLNTSGWGYVLLAPGANPNQVIAKLRAIIDRSVDLRTRMKLNMKGSDMEPPYLTPFRDDHLSTDQYGSMTPAGSWTIIYGFAAIGILILLVACFNFTNLATARATLRVREISLRKVMGATRKQLIIQFLGESLLTALIALLLALSLTEMLLPAFNRFLNIPITFQYVRDWHVLGLIITMAIAAGFLSGIYPALILSGFRPANTLRANTSKSPNSGILRTTLVVLQFAVSIGLGIAALVVFAQISFARHVDLGVRKDGVLVIDANNISASGRDSFAKALRSNPDITNVSVTDSFAIPFSDNNNNTDVNVPGNPSSLTFWVISADPGYAEVYGARLLQGRLLSEQHSADKVTDIHMSGFNFLSPPYNIMVNETGARMLGYSNAGAIGKTITVNGTPATIVGVTGDIKMLGASRPVRPTLYRNIPAFTGQVSVYLRSQHLSNTLGFIDRTWHAFAPSAVISRHFLSDDFEDQFQAVEKQGTMFALFVGIAIFIACLGLFGLASFAAERRTREIGLRKVFGARSRDIVWLLLWQFSIPVLIANLIAWPLAYYYLRNWLDGYAYRIGLSPIYFLAAGAVALVIAWTTVFAHASRVARANPIHALRYE